MKIATAIGWRELGLWSALALAMIAAGCSGSKPESANNPNRPELFTIPENQMSHVQVVTLQPTTLTRTLRLTGNVAYNGFRTTPVITQISGPVNRIVVVPGQEVRTGQPMLYVHSPDYSQLRTNYLKAKDAYILAQKNNDRTQDLYKHGAASISAVEQAE